MISYLQIAVPLINAGKAQQKNRGWGLNFGLKPISRINYKIQKNSRVTNVDSIATIYEGSGGLTEAFIGSGYRYKNFSFGANVGYVFGNKDYSTRVVFVNDSVDYYASNSSTVTHLGGIIVNGGVQYSVNLNKSTVLRLGGYGKLHKDVKATRDLLRETFVYNANSGSPDKLDSVLSTTGERGIVRLPASFGGRLYHREQSHFIRT